MGRRPCRHPERHRGRAGYDDIPESGISDEGCTDAADLTDCLRERDGGKVTGC
jgi:hypothetical protein